MNQYLKMLKENNWEPNFWCSEDYFRFAGCSIQKERLLVSWLDAEGFQMFPMIGDRIVSTIGNWWASFEHPAFDRNDFLDYNFIYNPNNFLNLIGRRWNVFRKNIKKFPTGKNGLQYRKFKDSEIAKKAFLYWLESRDASEEIQDDSTILNFMNSENKKILFDGNEVYGINIWDENFRYVNFRYCFCRNIPFLSEYLRYLFFLDMTKKNKYVNDGGSLGSEGLFKFKMRLNPVKCNRIKTKLKGDIYENRN
jgi:hypothetical protein